MSDEELLNKLLLKPGRRALVLNAPPSFFDDLDPLPPQIIIDQSVGEGLYDFVLLFALDGSELARLAPRALAAVGPDTILWIAYPKQSSGLATDLSRDAGWEIIETAGLRPVAQVAIDEMWSAVRWRHRGEASPQALIAAQFAGPKAHLYTLYERLVAETLKFDPSIKIAPRRSYIALQKNKTFALIKASTAERLDLGLKLPTYDDTERLLDSAGFGSGSVTHRVALHSMDDIDDELLAWLRAAYKTVI